MNPHSRIEALEGARPSPPSDAVKVSADDTRLAQAIWDAGHQLIAGIAADASAIAEAAHVATLADYIARQRLAALTDQIAKGSEPLAEELRALHEAARGCEFDLVPSDGPIARLALFMHHNGERVLAALNRRATSSVPPGHSVVPVEFGEVAYLQRALNALNRGQSDYRDVPVTGRFDVATMNALAMFMRLRNSAGPTIIEKALEALRSEQSFAASPLPPTGDEGVRQAEQWPAWLDDYLLGWAGLGPAQPWGAATSFALETAYGLRLIRGESDATLTEVGKAKAAGIAAIRTSSPDREGRDG